jgi:hypothetical protein
LVGVPDERLRPALDAAFAVAVEGRKQRPPVAPPEALRPYLRFQKLPRSALPAVRRMLDEDAEFRGRVAATVAAAEIGEALHAWLARPEGWQELAAELGGPCAGEPDDPTARREAKRRAAAESAAARAAAELAELRDAVERERAGRVAAEAAADDLRQLANVLRTEIDGLQKRARRAEEDAAIHERDRNVARDELGALQRVLDEAAAIRDLALAERAQLEDAIAAAGLVVVGDAIVPAKPTGAAAVPVAPKRPAVRGESPAGTAPPTPPDPARAVRDAAASLRAAADVEPAGAVREAAASLRSAAAALEVAAQAITVPARPPATPVPPRHRRPNAGHQLRRRPLAMPGGVSASSVDGALHLLRSPELELVVDGYNVAMLAWPALELAERRERCIDAVEDIIRRYGTRALVVFDGSDVAVAVSARRLARVQFSPPGVIADDVIREVVATLPTEQPVAVATNDREVVASVRAMGANTITSETLLAAAGRPLR